jgi:hypothetical protein
MPFGRGLKKEIAYVCISGLCALAFLYLVRPFGFASLGNRTLFGFGMVSIAAALVYIIAVQLIHRRYFGDRVWTIGWEIAYSLFFLVTVASAIMIYANWLGIMELNLQNFLLSILYTTLIGIIPLSIRAIMLRNWRLRKELAELQSINQHLQNRKKARDEKIIEFPVSRTESLKLINRDLLYLESSENYIHVNWSNGQQTKKQLVRMTMKDASQLINDPLIVFCHRSYIVNLRKVDSIQSENGRTTICLKDSEIQVPVSDTFKSEIRKKLGNIEQ